MPYPRPIVPASPARLARAGTTAATVALAALVALPSIAEAQRRGTRVVITRHDSPRSSRLPDRDLSLAVGVFDYDRSEDLAPMAALRAEWRLARWVRSELGVSYALADLDRPDLGANATENASLVQTSVGIKMELPTPGLRPYAGVAVGLFGLFPHDDGDDFVRPSLAVPVGVRIPLGRLNIRGEARFRFDEHPDGASVPSTAYTLGLGFRY